MSRSRLGATGRGVGLLLLASLSSLGAIVLAVQGFAVVNRMRLERLMLATVAQAGVSADTFNVYYFGSSTMVGEPYAPEMSIPQIVEAVLDGTVGGRPLRAVNLGKAGADFEYSVERLAQVVRHKDLTHPSLVVIYGGHNEFLKYHGRLARAVRALPRAYVDAAQRFDGLLTRLEIDDRRFLDVGVVDGRQREAVVQRFRAALEAAAELLSDAGVPAIVSTVAGNYADWEPNRSVYCPETAVPEAFLAYVDQGRAFEAQGQLEAAIKAYRDALALCATVAELHYRIASCARRLHQPAAAWTALERAVDDDGMPLRAVGGVNHAIRGLAGRPLVTVVDAVARLRELSPDGLIGFNLMSDGHHPNLRGYLTVAMLIAEAIRDRFDGRSRSILVMDENDAAVRFGIDARKRFEVAVSRGRWFARLATWRYDQRARLDLAEARFRDALGLDRQRYEPHLGLGVVQLLRREAAAGEREIERARALAPAEVDQYLSERWVQQIRDRAQRPVDERREALDGGR